jgi:signal transduction histidine kinase
MAARLRRPATAAVALAALMLAGAELDAGFLAWLIVAVCAVSYACGAYDSLAAGGLGVAVLLAALLIPGDGAVPFVLATVGPWAAGRIVRSRQELVGALRDRTRELEAEQEAFARLSVRRERARIAHELHDIVAHHLAVMVIHAGAGRMASGEEGRDGERLDNIREAGDQALAEMTRLVAMLQSDADDALPQAGRLRLLLDQARATGLDLHSTSLPPDVRLPAEVEEGAYRLVQEALTNAMKHAPGSTVDLRLSVQAGALEIELRDSGARAPSKLATTGSGLGLSGMRKRIEALGGQLDAGPVSGGGWRVRAHVPTTPMG